MPADLLLAFFEALHDHAVVQGTDPNFRLCSHFYLAPGLRLRWVVNGKHGVNEAWSHGGLAIRPGDC